MKKLEEIESWGQSFTPFLEPDGEIWFENMFGNPVEDLDRHNDLLEIHKKNQKKLKFDKFDKIKLAQILMNIAKLIEKYTHYRAGIHKNNPDADKIRKMHTRKIELLENEWTFLIKYLNEKR